LIAGAIDKSGDDGHFVRHAFGQLCAFSCEFCSSPWWDSPSRRGTASAHEGRHDGRSAGPSYSEPSAHHSHDRQGAMQGATEQQASADEAAKADGDAAPCPQDQSPDHASNNCCNVACHAALAATPADSIETCKSRASVSSASPTCSLAA
jgi:hypothetical protein